MSRVFRAYEGNSHRPINVERMLTIDWEIGKNMSYKLLLELRLLAKL